MKNKYASHDINLDIIRCAAIISLFSLHFLLNTHFYSYTVNTPETFIMCCMATLFRVCVPLFLLLSGYLLCRKQLSAGYYKGIIRILLTYLLASIICITVLHFSGQSLYTFKSAVLAIVSFNGSKYAWYVEMYLGLFILIPFFNLLWERLGTRGKRLAFVLTLLVLTLVPKILNSCNFQTPGWFSQPSLARGYDAVFPDWWAESYPITFYFLGAYLRDEGIRIEKRTNILLLIAAILVFCGANYYRSRNGVFVAGAPVDWGGAGNTVISVLFFMLIKDLKFTGRLPVPVKYCISRISCLSLFMYLVSAAADTLLYDRINKLITTPFDRLALFPGLITVIFVACAVVSELADRLAAAPLTKLCEKLYDAVQRKIERRCADRRLLKEHRDNATAI